MYAYPPFSDAPRFRRAYHFPVPIPCRPCAFFVSVLPFRFFVSVFFVCPVSGLFLFVFFSRSNSLSSLCFFCFRFFVSVFFVSGVRPFFVRLFLRPRVADQEYTLKVVRNIADEPATTAYPALVVSLGSGVSIIKVGHRQPLKHSQVYHLLLILKHEVYLSPCRTGRR